MGIRGRTSAAALAVIDGGAVVTIRRPEPLGELTEEQAEEWRAIVGRLPADWFPRETHGMLAQYCRHVVAARHVAQIIATMEAEPGLDVEAYDRVLKMQEREGRAISSLATRMRISQQATFDKTRKKPLIGRRPWKEEETG